MNWSKQIGWNHLSESFIINHVIKLCIWFFCTTCVTDVCVFAGLRWCFLWPHVAASVHSGGASVVCCSRPPSGQPACGYRSATEYSCHPPCHTGRLAVSSVVAGNHLPWTRVCRILQQWFPLVIWMMSRGCRLVSSLTLRCILRWVHQTHRQTDKHTDRQIDTQIHTQTDLKQNCFSSGINFSFSFYIILS